MRIYFERKTPTTNSRDCLCDCLKNDFIFLVIYIYIYICHNVYARTQRIGGTMFDQLVVIDINETIR